MYNILICDDEKDIVSALKIYLTPEGYTLYEAYDGLQALQILRENEIHLVLMDIMMPGLTELPLRQKSGRRAMCRLSCSQPKAKIPTRCWG